ncbi:heavy-metal-associated domain-containing protein [Aquimonas voraii]|uniref:Copper chaperone CopZ n=1 Tax=Aquimonas voraii TaxID=265719 RepID=A0A1G6SMJ1_9GAMM|nr:heavy-metal-associated domain-containing protein [Aquimonas voraii]SDD18079.1 Copper chaperone CopZ [Aquimonas voraii]
MSLEFALMNVKCGGCGNSIRRAVLDIEGVSAARLDVESGHLSVDAPLGLRAEIAARLLKLGYPEQGSVEGLAALSAGAKSFVSCAIGRFTDEPKS